MKFQVHASALAAALGLFFGSAAGGAWAASAAPQAHAHAPAASTALQLDHGKKWAIDAPLAQAMANIRNDLAARLEDIHADRLPADGYQALAKRVNGEVAYMVENCRLSPEADAQLHLVVADLLEGASAMENADGRHQPRAGAVTVIGALDHYARYFDDPGFTPIAH